MNSLLEPTTFDVTVDGRRLQVVTRGDTTAPAIVLVHGIRDHARSWDWIGAEGAVRLTRTNLRLAEFGL